MLHLAYAALAILIFYGGDRAYDALIRRRDSHRHFSMALDVVLSTSGVPASATTDEIYGMLSPGLLPPVMRANPIAASKEAIDAIWTIERALEILAPQDSKRVVAKLHQHKVPKRLGYLLERIDAIPEARTLRAEAIPAA